MTKSRTPQSPFDISDRARQAVDASQSARPGAATDSRPSILFCCPGSILDQTSGAALSMRTVMASLAARGFRAVALQATIFDSPQGGQHVMQAGESQKDKPIWRTELDGVEHLIVKTANSHRRFMNCQEEETYYNLFRQELANRRPDMVFLWGSLVLERTIMRECRDAGIPVVFYLVNEGYRDASVFRDVAVVVTDTQSTADLYRQRHGLDCKVIGKFINPALVKSELPRRPDFITFINPSFEKGVSIFMPLARMAAKECPEIRFMVVQSRGRWAEALQVLNFKAEDFPNVTVLGHRTDMRPVYASTRALLLPSLWHESGARVIAEAQINGIPVIASRTGGSAEMIGEAGSVIDVSEIVRQKKTEAVISDDELRAWLAEVRRVWHDATYYDTLCRNADARRQEHDINRSLDRFMRAVSPAVLRSKGMEPKRPTEERSFVVTPKSAAPVQPAAPDLQDA